MNKNEQFGKSNEEQLEQELQRKINTLPKELARKIEKDVEDMDLLDAIAFVDDFMHRRQEAKERIFTKVHTITDPQIQEEVRAVVMSIENTLGNHEYYLGEGTVGKVYRTPYAPHVCIKYIVDEHMFTRHGNRPRDEISYMEDLDGFSHAGIRTPRIYFEHMSDSVVCFGMETIEGMSLDKIIADPEACPFLEKIKQQSLKAMLENMKSFITELHEKQKLVHRDLATRNIMIDRDGRWWVIDFGKAKRIEIGDSSTQMSEATDYPAAENAVRKLFLAIQTNS